MTPTSTSDPTASRLWCWYAALGVALIVLSHAPLPAAVGAVLYDWFGVSAAVAIVWGVRRYGAVAPWLWYLLATAIAFVAAGDLAWSYDEIVRGIESPFPALPDALYLTAYPLLALALIGLSRRRSRDRGSIIDAAIIGIGYGVVAWVFFLAPYLSDPAYPLFERLVSAAYPGADILVVAATALLLLTAGPRSRAFGLLIVGTVVYVGADVLYAQELLTGSYVGGSWLDTSWMLGALLWGMAGLHPSMRDLARPMHAGDLMLTRWRLALLATAALAVPVLQLNGAGHDDTIDRYLISGATALLFLLVVLRLAGLIRTIAGRERRFRALAQNGGDLMAVLDADGAIRDASPSFRAVLGYDPATLIGRMGLDLVAPADRQRAQSMLVDLGRTPSGQQTIELGVLHADGSVRAIEAILINLLNDAEVGGLVVNARDVTARRRADSTLRTAQALTTSIIESSNDGMFAVDPTGVVTVWNRAMERTTGLPRAEVLGHDLLVRFPFLRELVEDALVTGALRGESARAPVQSNRIAETGQAGFYEAHYTPLSDDDSVIHGALGVVRDVTAQKALEAELARQAFHDALTGLPNRTLFADRLAHALNVGTRRSEPVAVLVLDLDRFKAVNDGLGHAAGDQVLIAVASRLSACLRDADTLARLGGDEFVILLEATTVPVAREVAARLLNALASPVLVDGREAFIGTSIGIAVSTPAHSSPDELMRAADLALYRAKAAGRNTMIVCDPATSDPSVGWLALEADLRRAVVHNEFVLHYQPIVDLVDGRVVTVEALVRWNHPRRGLLPPGDFITLAEETGLIMSITSWVIADACRQLVIWRADLGDLAPPTVNVNLTTRDLRDPGLVERITSCLDQAELPRSALRLEIIERVLVEELHAAAGTLRALHEAGIKLAIDDFGAGASSLASLRAVNAHVLKLDRAFIRGLEVNPDDRVVVRAIAAMARALGIIVTAEGIETPGQRDFARAAGCDRGQGFLFTRPLPVAEFDHWLTNWQGIVPRGARITALPARTSVAG